MSSLPYLFFFYCIDISGLDIEEIKKTITENNSSVDRIIFALNKIDELDLEEEELVEDYIDIAKNFLHKHGIENPKIFPICADYAKRAQIEELRNKIRFINYKNKFIPNKEFGNNGYELIYHASITPTQKEYLETELLKEDDSINKHLIYSGLAALKIYIKDYIDNHHKRNIYHQLLNEIILPTKKEINTKIEALKEEVKNKEEEIELLEEGRIEEVNRIKKKAQEDIVNLEKEIKEKVEKNKAKFIKNVYNEKVQISKFNNTNQSFENYVFDLKEDSISKKKLSEVEAKRYISNAEIKLKNKYASFISSLNNEVNNLKIDYINYLKSEAKKLYFDFDLKSKESKILHSKMENIVISFNVNSLMINYHRTEEREVKDRSFWGILIRVFGGKGTKIIKKTYYDTSNLYSDAIQPIIKEIKNQITQKIEALKKELDYITDIFLQKIQVAFDNEFKNIFEKDKLQIEVSNQQKESNINQQSKNQIAQLRKQIENINITVQNLVNFLNNTNN